MWGGNQFIWSQNSIISLMMKGKTKGEREKKKRDNKVACLFYFSPKWINSVLYIWVDIY